jgi:hypothetical protein
MSVIAFNAFAKPPHCYEWLLQLLLAHIQRVLFNNRCQLSSPFGHAGKSSPVVLVNYCLTDRNTRLASILSSVTDILLFRFFHDEFNVM